MQSLFFYTPANSRSLCKGIMFYIEKQIYKLFFHSFHALKRRIQVKFFLENIELLILFFQKKDMCTTNMCHQMMAFSFPPFINRTNQPQWWGPQKVHFFTFFHSLALAIHHKNAFRIKNCIRHLSLSSLAIVPANTLISNVNIETGSL